MLAGLKGMNWIKFNNYFQHYYKCAVSRKKRQTKAEALLEAFIYILIDFLLQRNEAGRMSGSNTRTTVLNRLVSDGELSQVMTNHFRLDFHLVEGLAVVHADHGAHHLGQDDHVSQVSFDHLWLLHGWRLLLGLAEAFKERLLLPPEAAVQPPPLPGAIQLHQLLIGHVQQLVQVHTSVGEFPEGTLLLLLSVRLRETQPLLAAAGRHYRDSLRDFNNK